MTTETTPGQAAIVAMIAGEIDRPQRYRDPDGYFREREDAADVAQIDADLAAAPAADRKRLDAERKRLDDLDNATLRAKAALAAGRDAIVTVRMAGNGDTEAMAAHEKAQAGYDRAIWEAQLQREVATRLRDQIVASVRTERASEAEIRLLDARERYQAAIARIVPTFAAIAALVEAHRLEVAAADDYAFARGEWRYGSDSEGFKVRGVGGNGKAHVQTLEPRIAVTLDGEPITEGDLARLRPNRHA